MRLGLGCLVAIVLAAACGGSGGGSAGTTSSGSTSSGSSMKCYSVAINQTNDGQTPCGPMQCAGNTYCVQNSGVCNQGCHSELECPANQTCDKSAGNMDEMGKPIGLCRVPNAAETVACPSSSSSSSGGTSCSDVCLSKAAGCGAPSDVAQTKCKELCAVATPDQVMCLEGKTCQEIGDAFSKGTTICGL